MAVFSDRMLPEVMDRFWDALARGEFITQAAESVGTYRVKGKRWMAATGGVRPRRGRDLRGRCLTFGEREKIALGRAAGESVRVIARRLGRSPSTVSRELSRNADRRGGYRATSAHAMAWERASRPKPAKRGVNLKLREIVERDLARRYSPEQIVGACGCSFPMTRRCGCLPRRSISHCSSGALRRELTACLRTGRKLRHPGRWPGQRRNRNPDMVNIAERPQEADDRAIPGHWEGDLLLRKNNQNAIGTLVERTTGYAALVHLPDGYKPDQVAPALAKKARRCPTRCVAHLPGTKALRCVIGKR
jgi:IS30 family transposase